MGEFKKIIYLDVDNTIINSKKRVAEIYNQYYRLEDDSSIKWEDVVNYNFDIESKIIKEIFDRFDFYKGITGGADIVEDCLETLEILKERGYKIIIYSKGTLLNIQYKTEFLNNRFGHLIDGHIFIGASNVTMGKNQVDMSGGILIDDHIDNLTDNNALYNICARLFNQDEKWNKDWKGKTIRHWSELLPIINSIERYEKLVKEIQSNQK